MVGGGVTWQFRTSSHPKSNRTLKFAMGNEEAFCANMICSQRIKAIDRSAGSNLGYFFFRFL